jgi:hypothetical protein
MADVAQQGKITAKESTVVTGSPGTPISIGRAAKLISAATTPPGTAAAAIGTSRPASTGIQRGNTSPQGRIRPSVRTTPSHDPVESASPHTRVLRSSASGASSGHGVSQVSRSRA